MRRLHPFLQPFSPFLRLDAPPSARCATPVPSSSPLFPTRLGFLRAQTTPKSQLFGAFPLFLEIAVPQSWGAVTELPLVPLASWRENKHPGRTATPCAPLSQRREDAKRDLTPLRTVRDLCECLFRFSAAPPWAAVTELPLAPLASWRENNHPAKTATPSAPLSQIREHPKRDLTPLRTLRDVCESLFRFSAAPPWAAVTELPLVPLASWRENKHPGRTATPCASLSQRREDPKRDLTPLRVLCGESPPGRTLRRAPVERTLSLCYTRLRRPEQQEAHSQAHTRFLRRTKPIMNERAIETILHRHSCRRHEFPDPPPLEYSPTQEIALAPLFPISMAACAEKASRQALLRHEVTPGEALVGAL